MFKERKVNILLATDLAARGLDIDGVKTVGFSSLPPPLPPSLPSSTSSLYILTHSVISTPQVINYNMPATVKQYIHRVGRTARAGHSGR